MKTETIKEFAEAVIGEAVKDLDAKAIRNLLEAMAKGNPQAVAEAIVGMGFVVKPDSRDEDPDLLDTEALGAMHEIADMCFDGLNRSNKRDVSNGPHYQMQAKRMLPCGCEIYGTFNFVPK